MMEGLVAIIGAIIGLFIYRSVGQKRTEAGQEKLQAVVNQNKEKDSELRRRTTDLQTDENKKVKEIEDEQNREVTTDQLVDFFNNRKGE